MRIGTYGMAVLALAACILSPLTCVSGAGEPASSEYIIGEGDVLAISIWKDENLTREVVVLPDGTISFPLVGRVVAEGKTISSLKTDIEDKIRRYVPHPVLNVEVKNINSMYIYVIGRVNNPGRYILNCNTNVLQALAMAGGLNPFADDNNIKIIRTMNGRSSMTWFRYNDIVKGKRLEQNIILERGDVIVVP